VPIAGMALLPALFGWPILLYPMHMASLELIIDPACALAFENESSEPDAMQRPPRDPATPLFDRRLFTQAILEGCGALLVVALAYFGALRLLPESEARAVLAAVFRFAPLDAVQFALAVAVGLLSIVWFEMVKFATHRR
jgi:Ca2+-transporting ATPase